jgi:hypothetical protein
MKIVLAAVVAAFTCVTGARAAEIQCAKHSAMLALLTKKFSENPVAMGTINQDRYMQLFVSPKGSWTILVTKTSGEACIVASGDNWENLPDLAAAGPAA